MHPVNKWSNPVSDYFLFSQIEVKHEPIPVKEVLQEIKTNVSQIKKLTAKIEKYDKKLADKKIDRYARNKFQAERGYAQHALQQLIQENQGYGKRLSHKKGFTPKELKTVETAEKKIREGEKPILAKYEKGLKNLQSSRLMRFFGREKFMNKDLDKLKKLHGEFRVIKNYLINGDEKTRAQIDKIDGKIGKALLIAENNRFLKILERKKFTRKDIPELEKLAVDFQAWKARSALEEGPQMTNQKVLDKIELKLGAALLAAEGSKLPQHAYLAINDAANPYPNTPIEASILKLQFIREKYPDPVRNNEIDLVLKNLKRRLKVFENDWE